MNPIKPNIAIVAGKGIGDALLTLIIAHNLQINNYDVTFYSNHIVQLKEWLPDIEVKPWPALEDCEKELSRYDLVLADNVSIVGKPYQKEENYPLLSKKYVYIALGHIDSRFKWDHTSRIKDLFSGVKFNKLANLASCSGTFTVDRKLSQAVNCMNFCKNRLKLNGVEKIPHFTPPTQLNLTFSKYPKRIVIHPFSTRHHKNWPLAKFIKLAIKLKKNGFDPVFISSSDERPKLFKELKNTFPAPLFSNLSELAAYTYESKLFVGNDSGPAHLASVLGIPTIVIIYHKRNHHWRADFTRSFALLPYLSIKIGNKLRIWKCFLPTSRVYNAVKKML